MSLREALRYASRGWPVFPVAADCRSPLVKHGAYDASSDPDCVAAMWRGREGANVAMACGQPSGVLALDIDRKGEVDGFACLAELEDENGFLPETPRQRTPSGGEHLLFRQPPDRDLFNKVGLRRHAADGTRTVFKGLDVRTSSRDGSERRSSIALAPSRKPHGPYTWILSPDDCPLAEVPAWLLLLFDPPLPPRLPPKPFKLTSAGRAARWVAAAVNGECGALARMGPNSGRNMRLFQAAANLGGIVATGLLPQAAAEAALEQAAQECGLLHEDGPRQVHDTIASGMRRGLEQPREVSF